MTAQTGSVDLLAVLEQAYQREKDAGQATVAQLAASAAASAVVSDLLAFAQGFVDNIDEWDGEPAPGMRWHREYLAAKSLLQLAGAAA